MKWQEVTDRESVYRMNGQTMTNFDKSFYPEYWRSIIATKEEKERLKIVLEFERTIRAINTDENGNVWKYTKENKGISVVVFKDTNGELQMFLMPVHVCLNEQNNAFEDTEKAIHAWKNFKPLFEAYYLNR